LDNEDENASLWIERMDTIELLMRRRANIQKVQAEIDDASKYPEGYGKNIP